MRFEIVNRQDVFEVRLSERLTFNDTAAFRKLFDDMRASGAKSFLLDMAGLAMIDSSGLGMLMRVVEDSKRTGVSITIKNAHGPVRQLLEVSRFDRLLTLA